MLIIKKYYGAACLAVSILFFSGLRDVAACPCFNEVFLQTVFFEHAGVECHMYREGKIISKMEIFDKEHHMASTTYSGCFINTKFDDYTKHYNIFYRIDHAQCVNAIINACNRLGANILLFGY